MAAVSLPALSQVRAFTADYLEEAATHWISSAQRWQSAYDGVYEQVLRPGGSEWVGEGADGAHLRVATDRQHVMGAVDGMYSGASAAREAAFQLTSAKVGVLEAVSEAEAAGYTVGDDYTVTNRLPVPAYLQAAREAGAQSFAANIRAQVLALVSADQQAAAQVTTAAAGLNGISFGSLPVAPNQGAKPSTQLLDDRLPLKDAPPDTPKDPGLPQPPGGWSHDPAMEDAQRIAYGHAWGDHIGDWQGMTQEQLAERVHDMLTGDPRTDPSLHVGSIPGRSSTAIYKDGILVIHDPLTGDGGTVYRPNRGFDEFLRLVGGAGAAPIISAPPTLPPTLPHPLTDPLPLQGTPHTPVTLPPSGIFDPNGLPPWLANPSSPPTPIAPPGPTIFPNVPLQSAPAAPPTPGPGLLPHIDVHLPSAGDLASAGQTNAPVAAGGLTLGAVAVLLGLLLSPA